MINRFKIFSRIMLLAMTSSLFAVQKMEFMLQVAFRAGIQLLRRWQMMMVMVFTLSSLICQV